MRLDVCDAAELAEMLQFLSCWLARDPTRLAASLEEFVGHPAYNISQLRQDLERFAFPDRLVHHHRPPRPPREVSLVNERGLERGWDWTIEATIWFGTSS